MIIRDYCFIMMFSDISRKICFYCLLFRVGWVDLYFIAGQNQVHHLGKVKFN